MTIVFNPVTKPVSWNGQPLVNGQLGPCDLEAVWFAGVGHLSVGGYTAKAWKAMVAICHNETGLHLSGTGAYRSYEQQVNVFLQRYTTTNTGVSFGQRYWRNQRWYLKNSTMAPVAAPGTSNHGLGIAIDTGWWVGKDAPGLADIAGIGSSAYRKGWDWLVDEAESFGFSWEGSRPGQAGWEPWHLRHVCGNDNTQRVKDIEAWFAAAGG